MPSPSSSGEERATAGGEPDGVEVVGVGQPLSEERADGEAGVERDREVGRGFAAAVVGREVLDGGGGADEHGRLADAADEAEGDERGERVGEGVGEDAERP